MRRGPADEAFVAGLVPRFVEHGAADGHTPAEVIAGTTRVLSEALRTRARARRVLDRARTSAASAAGFVYAVTERDFFTREPYLHVSEIAVARAAARAPAAR